MLAARDWERQVCPIALVHSFGEKENPQLSLRSRMTEIIPSVRRLALMHHMG